MLKALVGIFKFITSTVWEALIAILKWIIRKAIQIIVVIVVFGYIARLIINSMAK